MGVPGLLARLSSGARRRGIRSQTGMADGQNGARVVRSEREYGCVRTRTAAFPPLPKTRIPAHMLFCVDAIVSTMLMLMLVLLRPVNCVVPRGRSP